MDVMELVGEPTVDKLEVFKIDNINTKSKIQSESR